MCTFCCAAIPKCAGAFSTVFPGSRIRDWFKHCRKGHVIRIKASPNWYSSNFLGFAVSAVIAKIRHGCPTYCNLDSHDPGSESVLSSRIYSNSLMTDRMGKLEDTRDDHLWMAYIQSVFSFRSEKWSRIKFSFHTGTGDCNNVKLCGICPVYIKSSSDEDNSTLMGRSSAKQRKRRLQPRNIASDEARSPCHVSV